MRPARGAINEVILLWSVFARLSQYAHIKKCVQSTKMARNAVHKREMSTSRNFRFQPSPCAKPRAGRPASPTLISAEVRKCGEYESQPDSDASMARSPTPPESFIDAPQYDLRARAPQTCSRYAARRSIATA
jgi:hypothetical protein